MKEYSKHSDAELAALLRLGDGAAFTEIYERYWEKLYYIAVRKINDEVEAQESLQEIFFSLWKNREHFELRENLENYLAVAVKFQIIQRIAKSRRRNFVVNNLAREAEHNNSTESGNHWSQHDLEILQARLSTIVDSLPKKCRLVFNMSRSEEYTNKKIAAELGISEKAVEKHITYALKILRSKLGPKAVLLLLVNQLL